MGKKSRAKGESKRTEEKSKAPDPEPVSNQIEGDGFGAFDLALFATAAGTVAMVTLWFSLDVNRVFDVPKAFALKMGGCGILIAWVLFGVFGPGIRQRSLRLFVAPVFALLGAVAVSTLFSIDPWMSLAGVYERQFGLQGLLSCVGLFVVAATCIRSRKGAVAGLVTLMVLGAIVSAHAYLQSKGQDPWGFFKKPHNKVYATLGNATFAGNSLALIFPVSFILSVVASALSLSPSRWKKDGQVDRVTPLIGWVVGLVLAGGLLIVPAAGEGIALAARQTRFKLGCGFVIVLVAFVGLVGSYGHAFFRLESERNRRLADTVGAGALVALVAAMCVGLFTTRTRGAWVGTGVAMTGMFMLLPLLFIDNKEHLRKAVTVCGTTLVIAIVGITSFILVIKPNHIFSRTIKSIPYAFMPEKTVYGQGQGTRPYLWGESPRVLTNHGATLARMRDDRKVYAEKVPEDLKSPDFREEGLLPDSLRKILVWPFGIGIETYRFAFMSHKSKKLEALDPMTNHDNPHNNYLYTLASCGIIGLLAYWWLLMRLLSTAWGRFLGYGEIPEEKRRKVGLTFYFLSMLGFLPALIAYYIQRKDEERTDASRAERAVAFGMVLSFFSYSVYSIAGFDSVACSVFLYFLLGCSAAFFAPSENEPRKNLIDGAWEHFNAWRGNPNSSSIANPALQVAAVILIALPAAQAMYSINRVMDAERAFVTRSRSITDKIASIKKAIEINPRESFYRQSLGGTYNRTARQYQQMAMKSRREKKIDDAANYMSRAQSYRKRAEGALYSALNHAWAPENVFISLFQLYYAEQRMAEAELALERGLVHSPHLGPVRANLAVIKLSVRRAYKEALADALWVLEIRPANKQALRTAARSYHKLGQLDKAKSYYDRARRITKNDPTLKRFYAEYQKDVKAASSTTAQR